MSIWRVFECVSEHVSPKAIFEAVGHISEGEFSEAGEKLAKSFALKEVGNALFGEENNSNDQASDADE